MWQNGYGQNVWKDTRYNVTKRIWTKRLLILNIWGQNVNVTKRLKWINVKKDLKIPNVFYFEHSRCEFSKQSTPSVYSIVISFITATCPYINMSKRPNVHMSICLYVHMSVCPYVHVRDRIGKFCHYTFCLFIPFVVIRFVFLYVLLFYVLSLYTFHRYKFCLLIRFVFIRFVVFRRLLYSMR
jgi:hypothetical protein